MQPGYQGDLFQFNPICFFTPGLISGMSRLKKSSRPANGTVDIAVKWWWQYVRSPPGCPSILPNNLVRKSRVWRMSPAAPQETMQRVPLGGLTDSVTTRRVKGDFAVLYSPSSPNWPTPAPVVEARNCLHSPGPSWHTYIGSDSRPVDVVRATVPIPRQLRRFCLTCRLFRRMV